MKREAQTSLFICYALNSFQFFVALFEQAFGGQYAPFSIGILRPFVFYPDKTAVTGLNHNPHQLMVIR